MLPITYFCSLLNLEIFHFQNHLFSNKSSNKTIWATLGHSSHLLKQTRISTTVRLLKKKHLIQVRLRNPNSIIKSLNVRSFPLKFASF